MSRWHVFGVRPGGACPTLLPAFEEPTLLVFPATAEGEALCGAIAAASGAAMLGRIASLAREGDALVASRTTHGGRIAVRLRVAGGLAVAVVNDMPDLDGEIALGAPVEPAPERIARADQRVALESARIVLGGGRGLDEAGFALLERIAEALGGAVGASLPAVDLGLAPVSQQVGQSGKFVTPALYFAVGMSGTPQHLAGIGSATRLIALNNDPAAAIFRVAEAGAAADARTLLPLVLRAVEAGLAA